MAGDGQGIRKPCGSEIKITLRDAASHFAASLFIALFHIVRGSADTLFNSLDLGRALFRRHMVFSSLIFLFRFLPAGLLVYYMVPLRFRNLVLLVFSLGFYAWGGEPVYVFLMLASILVSYTGGILIDRFQRQEMRRRQRCL